MTDGEEKKLQSYQQLKQFFLYYVEHCMAPAMPGPYVQMVARLNELEQESATKAAAGLRPSINDFASSPPKRIFNCVPNRTYDQPLRWRCPPRRRAMGGLKPAN